MSTAFIVNGEFAKPSSPKCGRELTRQFNEVTELRNSAEQVGFGNMTHLAKGLIGANANDSAVNEQIDLMYREVDNTPTIERNPSGFQSTLQQLMSGAQAVNIGKKIVKKRRVGEAGVAGVSMSGRTDIVVDHTNSDYQGAIIPIFDAGYGVDWRDYSAGQSEGWDMLADDSREVQKTLLNKVDNFLWEGDSSISFDGISWAGLKGAQQGISQYSLQADLSAAATSAEDIVREVRAVINVLKIDNNLDGQFTLKVSRQIMANLLNIGNFNDSAFGSILDMIKRVCPELSSITEDPKLVGNQLFIGLFSSEGLHARSGMALSTYALPRFKHGDSFDFVKWLAVGFMANETKAGLNCAVYAS